MEIKKLVWNDNYVLDIEIVDQQHKQIFDRFNDFCDKINNNDFEHRDLEEFLEDLNYYTTTHFKTEEKLMRKENYPFYKDHKKRHKFFKTFYEELRDNKFFRYSAENLFSVYLAEIAAQWLESHVVTYDKELANFLKGKGY